MQGFIDRVFTLERFLFKLGRKIRHEEKYFPVFLEDKNVHYHTRMFEAHLHTSNN